jgi:hypothetical protein
MPSDREYQSDGDRRHGMTEGEWSSPEAAEATRAAVGGCFKVAFLMFAVLMVLSAVVGFVIDRF